MSAYNAYVGRTLRSACEARWSESVSHLDDYVPYTTYTSSPPRRLTAWARKVSVWGALQHARGWCGLRAQVVPLAHIEGRPTRGHGGRCIFCGESAPRPYHHTFGECQAWREEREQLRKHEGLRRGLGNRGAILDVLDPEPGWEADAAAMAGRIDARARQWWYEKGGGFA